MLGDKSLHVGDERLGLGRYLCGGGKALAQMPAQIPHHPADALQLRHVHVEVHPVDALALEHDVISQDFAHAVW